MTSAPTPFSQGREPELTGQTVAVIGGSAGTGLETARRARATVRVCDDVDAPVNPPEGP